MEKGLNNPAMPAPKQLRIVLIIVLLTVPATICGVLAWFVLSHTWADQVAEKVSAELPGTVHFGDLQLAGPAAYVVSDLSYQDAGLSFTSERVEYGLGQENLCTGNTLSIVDANGLNGLMELVCTGTQFMAKNIQWKQMSGDLVIDPRMETASSVPMPHISIEADGKCSFDDVRLAVPALPPIPLWIHGDEINIKAFSLDARKNILTEGMTWQGLVSLVSKDTQCEFKWTQSASKQLCSIQYFSDARLPQLEIKDNNLFVFGQQWWTKVNILRADDSWLLVGFDADKKLRSLRITFEENAVNCVFENIQTLNVKEYFDKLVDLPDFLKDYAMAEVDISGSMYVWNEQNSSIHAHAKWNANTLSGQWNSTDEAITLTDAVFTSSECSLRGDLSCRQKKIRWDTTQVQLKKESMWSSLLGDDHESLWEISAAGLSVSDESNAFLHMKSAQQWLYSAKTVGVSLVNTLCARDLFTSGEFWGLRVQRDGAVLDCTAAGKQLQVSWPVSGWSALDAQRIQYHGDDEGASLRLRLANSLWSAQWTHDSIAIHTWPSMFSIPFLSIPVTADSAIKE